jgi:hypothetical protein
LFSLIAGWHILGNSDIIIFIKAHDEQGETKMITKQHINKMSNDSVQNKHVYEKPVCVIEKLSLEKQCIDNSRVSVAFVCVRENLSA